MTYIGPEPNPGQNREVDDISSGFNGSEVNFTLQVNSQNVSPGSANAIIVSLGGVVQNPGTDYTIAASTITFTTAPANGLSFFGLVLGQGVDISQLADDSVTVTKLAANAVTTAKIADSTGASDGITTAKIATSAITTAKIADQAVDLSKLPHGTGSTDGKFLRANNGADPTFETVDTGGMTLLSTTTFSSSGSVIANVTGLSLSTYKYLYGQMHSVARSGGGQTGDIIIRFNGLSTNIYKYVMQRMDNNGSYSNIGHNSQNGFYYNMTGVADFSSTINFAHFTLHLLNEGSRKTFEMVHGGELSGGPIVLTTAGYWDNTGAVTSVEVQCSNNDVNAGTLKLYGVK